MLEGQLPRPKGKIVLVTDEIPKRQREFATVDNKDGSKRPASSSRSIIQCVPAFSEVT